MGFPCFSTLLNARPDAPALAGRVLSVLLQSACKDASGACANAAAEPLLTGTAALADKAREDPSKSAEEAYQRQRQGRYVIVTDVDGQEVAIVPYLDEQAARAQLRHRGPAC
jgi:hypothetical protein